MLDIFRTLPGDARRENLAAYREFLIARDGTKDLQKRQLSRREQGMARYERPSRASGRSITTSSRRSTTRSIRRSRRRPNCCCCSRS